MFLAIATLLGLTLPAFLAFPAQPLGNLAPAEALKAFETEPRFVVELVAAEPLTIDPVALAFDERGRLYVAENRDYPTGSPDGRPLGRIALLEDTDRDGRMDRRNEFADGIKFPNGVMGWRGGVIVTASPDVWWLSDTNGDGRADVKELLLTGFATNSTSQLRANDPTLGLDGWVYIAGGLQGGKVSSPKRPGTVVDTERGDLRFKPDTGEMELVAGKSQYGLAFDDAGNRFACMNRIQSQHAPIALRYLARNPRMPSPGTLHNCPEIHDNTLMTRYTAGAARYYPISANITTADSHVGTYSAACAIHIYRGVALPEAYHGAAFSCDPTGNLVRGDRLEKSGGTFAAHRLYDGTEALRSRDNWFRPVFLADGPDGALYIADMYRKTIEHPDYLPGDVRKHTDFESGKDQGRIWRLTRQSTLPKFTASFPAATNLAELIAALSWPNPWHRDTAFRLLVERNEPRIGMLARATLSQKAAQRDSAAAPTVMLLHLGARYGSLDKRTLLLALRHRQPAVRQNAILLAESRMAGEPTILDSVLVNAHHADPHVRLQVALSVGEMPVGNDKVKARVLRVLDAIAGGPAVDQWTRAAIQSSVSNRSAALDLLETIGSVQRRGDGRIALASDLGRQLAADTGAGPASFTHSFFEVWHRVQRADPALGIATLAGFAAAAGDRFQGVVSNAAGLLAPLMIQATRQANNPLASIERRRQAVDLLAYQAGDRAEEMLIALLESTQPTEVQQAAARALFQPARAARLAPLLAAARWNASAPAVRNVMLARLAARPEMAALLLDALETGSVPVGVVMPGQRDQLRKLNDAALRARVEKLFAKPGGDRGKALEEARAALALQPVPANGRAVFERTCATCHRFNQEGVAVGPDLFDIRHQPKESILYHIVIPEAEIAPNFVNYECELKDGRVLSGLLSAETTSQITLRMTQGLEEIIPRQQIRTLAASRLSLMPQELEKMMTSQELADLLAYLRGEQ